MDPQSPQQTDGRRWSRAFEISFQEAPGFVRDPQSARSQLHDANPQPKHLDLVGVLKLQRLIERHILGRPQPMAEIIPLKGRE